MPGRRAAIVFLLQIALGVWPRGSAAQETVTYASVSGRVTDQTGAVLAGAEVTARHAETNVTATARTDAEGRFRFAYLRVGPYEITARAAGFTPATRRLTLTVGAAFDLPIALAIGALQTDVVVAADSTVLEAVRSQIAGTVSQKEVATLPMSGRSFLDLALLVPGVSPTNVGGGTQLFPETSAIPGVGLSVGSQRNLSNNFMVDGLSANDDAAALSGMSFAVDAVDQLQVVTSGGQAELGRALGGHINVATRSGTNAWRADGYGFFRDDRLNAANPLLVANPLAPVRKLPMRQQQYGGSLGGPLVRNRTFVFANVERRDLDQAGLVTIPAATVAAINARLAAVSYPGPPVATGLYPNPIDTRHVMGKVDHHLTAQDLLTVRYSAYDVRAVNARGAGGTSAASASAGVDNLDQTLAIGNVRAISTRTVLETRGQIAHGDLAAPPADAIGPAVSIAGVAAFGTLSTSPTRRENRLSQVVTNLTHQRGAHALRSGADVLHNDLAITFPRSERGSYSFASLAGFLAGVYNNAGFTQTFGERVVAQTNPNVGVYLQDEWRARANLTINAGLRYDLQFLETIATDTDNLSPRLGFVWAPFAARRTLIRASAGRFYDRVPLRALANALLSAGNTTDLSRLRQVIVALSPAQSGAPAFPGILPEAIATTSLVNLTTMDPRLQNAYSDQAAVEIEHQAGAFTTIGIGYQHLRGRRLLMQINQNVPSCPVAGNNNGCRPNPAFANHNQYSAAGRSVYDGLHVSIVQRPAKWGSYRLSYTWSTSMNNIGEAFFSAPIDPFDLSKDWARSDDDQRHRLVATGTIRSSTAPVNGWRAALTHGFTISGVVQYYSALPFNITTGANTVHGTPARPVVNGEFIPRNAGEGSAFSTTSLRVSRTFAPGPRARLEALVEVFNLFNRRNDIARVTVFGPGEYPDAPAPNFGAVTAVGEPRAVQVGFRLRY